MVQNGLAQQHGLYRLGSIAENAGDFKNRKPTAGRIDEKIEKDLILKLQTKNKDFDPLDQVLENEALIQLNSIYFTYNSQAIHLNQFLFAGDLNFNVYKSSRIVILGKNGLGKSTILKLITNELQVSVHLPSHIQLNSTLDNSIKYHPKLKIGYYSQHMINSLDKTLKVIDYISLHFNNYFKTSLDIRTYLGKFYLRKDITTQYIKTLSGGQKARLCLALIMINQPNVLILDEITSHLDAAYIKALIQAINQFNGAVIIVSHNREFISKIIQKDHKFHQIYVLEENKKKN